MTTSDPAASWLAGPLPPENLDTLSPSGALALDGASPTSPSSMPENDFMPPP